MAINANWIKPGGPTGTADPKNEEAPAGWTDTAGTALTGPMPPWSPDNGKTLYWCGGAFGNVGGGGENKFASFDMWKSIDLPNHTTWGTIDAAHAPAPISLVGPFLNFMDARFTLSTDGTKVIVAYVSIPNGSAIKFQDFSLLTGLWGPVYGTGAPVASHVNNIVVRRDGTYLVIYSPEPAGGSNLWATISAPGGFTSWTNIDIGTNYAPFSGGAAVLNKNECAVIADGLAVPTFTADNVHVIYQDGNAPPTYIYQLIKPNNTLGLFTVLNKIQTIRTSPNNIGNLVKFGCYLWMCVQGDVTDRFMWSIVMPLSQPGLWGKLFIMDPGTMPGTSGPITLRGGAFSTDGQSLAMIVTYGTATTSLIWMATTRDGLSWMIQLVYDPTDVNNVNPVNLDVVPPFIFRTPLYKSGPGYSYITVNAVSTAATASDCALGFNFTPALPSLCQSSYGSVPGTGGGGGAGPPSANGGALPPPPIMTPLLNERGTPSLPWVSWFNAVYQAEITGV